ANKELTLQSMLSCFWTRIIFLAKGAWQLLREQEGGAGVDGGRGRSRAEFR
ncbi:hypothetical protein QQF64_030682, partial [Cirrhinus molitorella]